MLLAVVTAVGSMALRSCLALLFSRGWVLDSGYLPIYLPTYAEKLQCSMPFHYSFALLFLPFTFFFKQQKKSCPSKMKEKLITIILHWKRQETQGILRVIKIRNKLIAINLIFKHITLVEIRVLMKIRSCFEVCSK